MTDAVNAAALILAAGRSARFGEDDKLLFEIDGTPMIRRTAEAVASAGLDDVVVVTGDGAPAIEKALNGLALRCIRNATPWVGMGTSLAVGVNALAGEPEALFVVLGDMPYLQSATIAAMLSAFDPRSGRDIVVPVHDGRRGHPVLFGRRYLTRLSALSGDVGARQILKDHPERVLPVTVDDPGTLLDIDTPEDAGKVRQTRP